jgi:hypothetical protein
LDSNISIPYGGLDYIGPVETIGQPSIWNNTFSSLARYAGKRISVVSGGKFIGAITVPTNSTDTHTSTSGLSNRTLTITNYVLHISGSSIFELGIGLQYECELQTTPIELGEPTRAFTGAKTQLVSANFKMSNSYFGFYFGVGENLTGHGLPNPNTVNNSYTGDLRLMGSVGEDAGIIIKTTVPLSFGLSQISIVYKITESSI